MVYFDWNAEKNEWLKRERGIGFEDVLAALEAGGLADIVVNPSKQYPAQKVLIVVIEEYVYAVPFIESDEKIFLKTVIPSRKATKRYLRSRNKK